MSAPSPFAAALVASVTFASIATAEPPRADPAVAEDRAAPPAASSLSSPLSSPLTSPLSSPLTSPLTSPGALSRTDRRYYEAWGVSPDDPDLHYEYGNLMMEFGDVVAARESFESALRLDSDHAGAHYGLGTLLLSEESADDSLSHFLAVLASGGGAFEIRAHMAAGRLLGRTGRGDEALPHFEKAVALDGERSDTRFNLGLSLARHGRLAEATVHLEKALVLDAKFVRARRRLASVLAEQERFEEAVPHYEELMLQAKHDPVAPHDLAVVFGLLGDAEKSRAMYERSLAVAKKFKRYSEMAEQLEERLRETAP